MTNEATNQALLGITKPDLATTEYEPSLSIMREEGRALVLGREIDLDDFLVELSDSELRDYLCVRLAWEDPDLVPALSQAIREGSIEASNHAIDTIRIAFS